MLRLSITTRSDKTATKRHALCSHLHPPLGSQIDLTKARERKALQTREHLRLRRRVHVQLRRRAQHGDARIAALADDAALVGQVVRAARLGVRLERIPHEAREHELVRGRGRAVVGRRVVDVHDRPVGEVGPRAGSEGGDERVREVGVDLCGQRRGACRVRLERRVRDLGPARPGEGGRRDAIARRLASSTAMCETSDIKWKVGRERGGHTQCQRTEPPARGWLYSLLLPSTGMSVGALTADIRAAHDKIGLSPLEKLGREGLNAVPRCIHTSEATA